MSATRCRRLGAIGVVLIALLLGPTSAHAAPPDCDTPIAVTATSGITLSMSGSFACFDDEALTFSVKTPPQHGTLVFVEPDEFDYKAAAGYAGADTFEFDATNAADETTTVHVDVTVGPDQPPACDPAPPVDAEPDQSTPIEPFCDDPDFGQFLTFTVIDPPSHGSVTGDDVAFLYTPTPGYSGPDSFTFRASDGLLSTGLVKVAIRVLKPNHLPHCVTPLTVNVRPNQPAALNVMPCSDPDGDPLFPTLLSGPSHGTLTLVDDVVVYLPNRGFLGTDQIGYQVGDPRGGVSNDAVVKFVVARPAPPTATPARDTKPPFLALDVRRERMRTLRRQGLRLVVDVDEPCVLTAAVSADRRTVRRLKLRRALVGSTALDARTGRNVVIVKLQPAVRRALRKAKRVRLRVQVTATDSSGNRRIRNRTLVIRR